MIIKMWKERIFHILAMVSLIVMSIGFTWFVVSLFDSFAENIDEVKTVINSIPGALMFVIGGTGMVQFYRKGKEK